MDARLVTSQHPPSFQGNNVEFPKRRRSRIWEARAQAGGTCPNPDHSYQQRDAG